MNKVYIDHSDNDEIVAFTSKEVWNYFNDNIYINWKNFIIDPFRRYTSRVESYSPDQKKTFIEKYINEPVIFEVYLYHYFVLLGMFETNVSDCHNYFSDQLIDKYKFTNAVDIMKNRIELYRSVESIFEDQIASVFDTQMTKALFYLIDDSVFHNKNRYICIEDFMREYMRSSTELYNLFVTDNGNRISLPEKLDNTIDMVYEFYCQASCNGYSKYEQDKIDNIIYGN